MVKSLEAVTASANFTINCRKTKTLSLKRNAKGLVQVGSEQIGAVDKFTYLGSEIEIYFYFVSCWTHCESKRWPKTEDI